MASVLKVDTITGVATAGSIAITGEGNSTTTNLQQGLAKAWCNVDGTATFDSSDTEIRDSFNVDSTVDNGTGDVTVSFTNNMGNASYSVSLTAKQNDSTNASGTDTQPASLAQGSYRIITNDASFAKADCALNFSTVHGDLA